MATYALRRLDPDIVQRAKARARDAGTSLDDVLRAALKAYADGHDTAAQQLGAEGGRASAAARTPRERSEAGRHAVRARWAKRQHID